MQDFEIHVINKDNEENPFPYQGLSQNICNSGCLISVILIIYPDIRHDVLFRNKLPEQLAW